MNDFNPRSPRGERPRCVRCSDMRASFQSTLPAWGATRVGRPVVRVESISIHAPRVGSDSRSQRMKAGSTNFNPRSPRGERQDVLEKIWIYRNFNPRSPRGERQEGIPSPFRGLISIHAPRVGSDQRIYFSGVDDPQFQSTLPAWGATLPPLS